MEDKNEEILRRFASLWATREADAMAECFADDGVYDNVPAKKPLKGRQAILDWLTRCFEHLTRIDVEFINIASNGEWILSERLDTHVMDDKHMPLPVMNACRIVDGKIVMFRDYYDQITVKELGMG